MIWRSNKTLLPGFPLCMPSVSGILSSFPFKQAGTLNMRMSRIPVHSYSRVCYGRPFQNGGKQFAW